jgi:hypothetical protein
VSLASRPTRNQQDQWLPFFSPLPLGLSGMGDPTRSLLYKPAWMYN